MCSKMLILCTEHVENVQKYPRISTLLFLISVYSCKIILVISDSTWAFFGSLLIKFYSIYTVLSEVFGFLFERIIM